MRWSRLSLAILTLCSALTLAFAVGPSSPGAVARRKAQDLALASRARSAVFRVAGATDTKTRTSQGSCENSRETWGFPLHRSAGF